MIVFCRQRYVMIQLNWVVAIIFFPFHLLIIIYQPLLLECFLISESKILNNLVLKIQNNVALYLTFRCINSPYSFDLFNRDVAFEIIKWSFKYGNEKGYCVANIYNPYNRIRKELSTCICGVNSACFPDCRYTTLKDTLILEEC